MQTFIYARWGERRQLSPPDGGFEVVDFPHEIMQCQYTGGNSAPESGFLAEYDTTLAWVRTTAQGLTIPYPYAFHPYFAGHKTKTVLELSDDTALEELVGHCKLLRLWLMTMSLNRDSDRVEFSKHVIRIISFINFCEANRDKPLLHIKVL